MAVELNKEKQWIEVDHLSEDEWNNLLIDLWVEGTQAPKPPTYYHVDSNLEIHESDTPISATITIES